jgi:protease-4
MRWKGAVIGLAALAGISVFSAGCVYMPIDLGLQDLGKVQEVTLVDSESEAKVLLLRIDGEISDEPSSQGLFTEREGTVAHVKDVLDLARDDRRVKALLVRIDSPGGGVTASDIIYHELLDWKRRTKKPVVALFMDTAASGGYYIAQAADRIVSHPTAVTGSIGVIALLPDVSGLGDKIGVKVNVVKSGALKDMGNPFRPMDPDDRKVFQQLIDDMYQKFVSVVADGRRAAGLTREQVLGLADGRVYTAQDARKAKLVDEVGYFEDAIRAAEKLAGVSDAKVVTYERKGIGAGRHTLYSKTEGDAIQATLAGRGPSGDTNVLKIEGAPLLGRRRPTFNYLWIPGL